MSEVGVGGARGAGLPRSDPGPRAPGGRSGAIPPRRSSACGVPAAASRGRVGLLPLTKASESVTLCALSSAGTASPSLASLTGLGCAVRSSLALPWGPGAPSVGLRPPGCRLLQFGKLHSRGKKPRPVVGERAAGALSGGTAGSSRDRRSARPCGPRRFRGRLWEAGGARRLTLLMRLP